MHVACAALLFSLVRRRAGAWPAAFAAILLLWALDRDRPGLAASVDVRPTSPAVLIRPQAPAKVELRRFGQWRVRVTAAGPVTVCSLP